MKANLPAVDYIHGHALFSYSAAIELYGGAGKAYTVHSPLKMELRAGCAPTLGGRLRKAVLPLLADRLERRCLLKSDAVNSFSQYTKDCLAHLHGPEIAKKVQVLAGWADTNRFHIVENRQAAKRELGWPVDVPVLFTLRRLVPRMGLDRLLRAVRILADEQHAFNVVIGGEGLLRPELEALARELRISDKVRFIGRVPESLLPLTYGACDCFVLPTAELECFGLIAVEAFSAGRPVLATPVGALPELMELFEPKWLAAGSDENSIARLIGQYLKGRLPHHEPQELRDIVERHFSREHILPMLAEVLLGEQCERTKAYGRLADWGNSEPHV